MAGAPLLTSPPSIDECRDELRTVFASRTFKQSPRLARLLQYISSKALLGENEQVTEYTIALDVFGKPEGFRESKDAIVRVEVHRLRKKLEAFYNSEGTDHRVRIVIPPGTYTADFRAQSPPEDAQSPAEEEAAVPRAPHVAEAADAFTESVQDTAAKSNTTRKWPWTGVAAILAVIAIGIILLTVSHRVPARAGTRGTTPAPAVNTEVHILAGYSGDAWKDVAGNTWVPDRYFRGGQARGGVTRPMVAPPDSRLFRNMREGSGSAGSPESERSFAYDIPMRPGTYELRLYFADPLRDSLEKPGEDGENARRFIVSSNGQTLLEQFDAVADQGYADADVRAFRDIVPASDGKVHLEFAPGPHLPFVNAIELVPSSPGHANPIRLVARLQAFTDADGRLWEPDNYYTRGRLVRHAVPTQVHDFPELLRGERYGNFSYAIPEPEGTYTLKLYFAETMFGPFAPSTICRGSGCRVFDVSCNGTELLHQFDIFQEAGGAFRPVVRTFHGLRPNGQGKLLISFSPSINYAEVRAMEVLDEAR